LLRLVLVIFFQTGLEAREECEITMESSCDFFSSSRRVPKGTLFLH
jgi:hypothetical protein